MVALKIPDEGGSITFHEAAPIEFLDFRTSVTIGKLTESVAKARSKMGNVAKNAANPHFRSRYADLAAVTDELAALFAEGVMVFQSPGAYSGKAVQLHTRLSHSSGEWIHTTLGMPVEKPTAQGVGSAITYARRYALQSLLCLAAEDDDGEQAVGRKPSHEPRVASHTPRDDEEPPWFRTEPATAAVMKAVDEQEAAAHDTRGDEPFKTHERQILEAPTKDMLAAAWSAASTAKKAGLVSKEQLEILRKLKDVAKASFDAEPPEPGSFG